MAKNKKECVPLPELGLDGYEIYLQRLTEGIRKSKEHTKYLQEAKKACKEKIEQLKSKKCKHDKSKTIRKA